MAERRRAHHTLVHKMLAQGAGFRQIARHLGWSHKTVSKYAHAATWQELVVGQKPRPSLVDPFKPYLLRRIGEGRVKVSTLYREITAQGFTGSYPIVPSTCSANGSFSPHDGCHRTGRIHVETPNW